MWEVIILTPGMQLFSHRDYTVSPIHRPWRFAEWAGSILPFDENDIAGYWTRKEEESIIRLSRAGFEKMEGYLKGGFEA